MKPVSLDRLRYRPVHWLWPGRIPRGMLTLLAGRAEVGKSSLLSDIAARVSSGELFPDEEEPTDRRDGRVLICCREEDKASALLGRVKEHDGAVLRHIQADDTAFVLADEYDHLARRIREDRIDCLVCDPLASYLRHQTGQPLRAELERLNEFARRYDVAVVGVVQLVKSWRGSILASMRGGGQFSEVARQVLAVAQVEPANPASSVLLGTIKSNVGTDMPHIGFRLVKNLVTGRPQVVWLPDTDLPAHASLDDLVALGSKIGKVSTTKLAAVEDALTALLADGPRPAEEVMEITRRQTRAGERTIREAKARLGVESEKRGTTWWWWLPSSPGPEAADPSRTDPPRPSPVLVLGDHGDREAEACEAEVCED